MQVRTMPALVKFRQLLMSTCNCCWCQPATERWCANNTDSTGMHHGYLKHRMRLPACSVEEDITDQVYHRRRPAAETSACKSSNVPQCLIQNRRNIQNRKCRNISRWISRTHAIQKQSGWRHVVISKHGLRAVSMSLKRPTGHAKNYPTTGAVVPLSHLTVYCVDFGLNN